MVNSVRMTYGTLSAPGFVVTFSKRTNLRTDICFKVVQLLCEQNIKLSSIDLARFCWFDEEEKDEENVDTSEDEDDRKDLGDKETKEVDINEEIAPYGKLITTPVTIWIGVLPDSLSGERAHHSSQAILALLKEGYGITDVDIAYRESTVKFSSGHELFAPALDLDPLKNVIDSVTTALGLPIAGLKSLKSHGTLGFYFRVNEALYGVTACHVLFSEDEANDEYRYVPCTFPRRDNRTFLLITPPKPHPRRRLL